MPVLLRPEQFEPASWRGMGQMLEGRVQSFSQIQLGLAVPVTDSSGDGTSHLLVLNSSMFQVKFGRPVGARNMP